MKLFYAMIGLLLIIIGVIYNVEAHIQMIDFSIIVVTYIMLIVGIFITLYQTDDPEEIYYLRVSYIDSYSEDIDFTYSFHFNRAKAEKAKKILDEKILSYKSLKEPILDFNSPNIDKEVKEHDDYIEKIAMANSFSTSISTAKIDIPGEYF